MANEPSSHLGTRMAHEVWHRIQRGGAWSEYQRDKVPLGIAYCRQRGLSLQDAEDLVQRFSLHFYVKEAPQYLPGQAKILPRLYRYLNHRIIEAFRKKQRDPTCRALSLDEPVGDEGLPRHECVPARSAHPATAMEPALPPPTQVEVLAWLKARAEKLPPDEQERWLRDVDIFDAVGKGEKQKDVAARHGIHPSRISQIVDSVQDHVRKHGPWSNS
jgi:DNA-directed RNA polymerase specialized sigma24 family protein